ncbi:MAG: NAD(P)-binding domain-containing protein, partial [Bacillota bacterium]
MEIGLIGLGKMGFNLALNMVEKGHRVVAYNRSPEKTKKAETRGIGGAYSLPELV